MPSEKYKLWLSIFILLPVHLVPLFPWDQCSSKVLTVRITSPSFVQYAVCLTTGPEPLPKRVLHRVRSNAFFFNLHYSLVSLRSSSDCLRLFPTLPAISILPSIFPSTTRFRTQFLCKMWPVQLDFLLLLLVGYSSPLTFFLILLR
jgi:hypothetical protein